MSKTFRHTPMGRFDWERVIARAELPSVAKAVALLVATRANADGSGAHPGERWLADVLDKTERYIGTQVSLLRDLGLIERTAFGRAGKSFDVYQLTVPGPADIPLRMRLDPDGRRYKPRPDPKPRKPRTVATGSPLLEDDRGEEDRTGSGLPVGGESETEATGNPLPEGGPTADAATGTPVRVDNPEDQNPASGSDVPDQDRGSRSTGNLVQSYRKPGADLPEPDFGQGDPYQPSTNLGWPQGTIQPVETIKPVENGDADRTGPIGKHPRTAGGHRLASTTFGADVLDGDGHTSVAPQEAYAEMKEAARLLAASGERDRWVSEARAALAAKGDAFPAGIVTAAAAELLRRSLATAHAYPNGGS